MDAFEADAVWREAVCSPSLLCIEWTGSVRPADKEISDWGWEGRFRSDTFCIVERTVCGAMPPAGESVFRDAGGVHAHAKLCSSRDVIFPSAAYSDRSSPSDSQYLSARKMSFSVLLRQSAIIESVSAGLSSSACRRRKRYTFINSPLALTM